MKSERWGIFQGDPVVVLMDDGKNVLLTTTIRYRDPKGYWWSAKAGLVTDGASIPRWLWPLTGSPLSGGKYVRAALFHDEHYRRQFHSRRKVDWMFYCAMRCSGHWWIGALNKWFWVRLFGWIPWNKCRRDLIRGASERTKKFKAIETE